MSGSPLQTCLYALVSFSRNDSAMLLCSSSRLVVVHRWPAVPTAPNRTVRSARSWSASGRTTQALLPPSSRINRPSLASEKRELSEAPSHGGCACAELVTLPGLDRPANNLTDLLGTSEADKWNLTVFSQSLRELNVPACKGSDPSRQLVLLQHIRDDSVTRNGDQAASIVT